MPVTRMRRRPIMIAADASRALLLLSVPVAAVFHVMTLWQLYAVLFLTVNFVVELLHGILDPRVQLK